MSKLKVSTTRVASGTWEDVLEKLADQVVQDNKDAEGTNPKTWEKELAAARKDVVDEVKNIIEKVEGRLHNGEYTESENSGSNQYMY